MASWRLQLSVSQGVTSYTCGCWTYNRCFSIRARFAEGEKIPSNQITLHTSQQEVSKLAGISANEERQLTIRVNQLSAEREEAKAVLLQFLKNLGLSTALSTRLTKKGGRFVDHLLSLLHTRYHRCYVTGREPTTAEIQGTLLSYLEALASEHGEGLVDFLVYFPEPPPVKALNIRRGSVSPSTSKPFPRKDGIGTSGLTVDGNYKPSVSYALSLGLTLEQVEVLAKKSPSFISCRPERNIQPVVSYFLGLGVSKPGIVKILLKRPQVFVCNLEEYLKPSMLHLESLGIKRNQWPRVIVKFPALLTYGMPKIEATMTFLHAAGLSSADVGTIISRFPHIVSFNVEEKLEPTLEFLKSIGVRDVALFLKKSPQVLGYSVEGNIRPTVRFLIELGYSQTEVTKIINKFPQILSLAINSNIKPKWDFYAETGLSRSHLVAFPQYFGDSLEARIKPRFKEILRHGLDWTPNRILSTSNRDFEKFLRIHVEGLENRHPAIVGINTH
ncbi:hypothetical protein L7F22_004120 [Adiantum nelumboides]|nr:hypothetical protein [Adiantum nelumboides]